jgi:hypothetical protein
MMDGLCLNPILGYILGVIDCNEWKTEMPQMHKYEGSRTTRIMMATVRDVTSNSGL